MTQFHFVPVVVLYLQDGTIREPSPGATVEGIKGTLLDVSAVCGVLLMRLMTNSDQQILTFSGTLRPVSSVAVSLTHGCKILANTNT